MARIHSRKVAFASELRFLIYISITHSINFERNPLYRIVILINCCFLLVNVNGELTKTEKSPTIASIGSNRRFRVEMIDRLDGGSRF